MKTLIVFYSRSGCTRNVAESLAAKLGADTEEIIDTKNRAGALGYIAAGKDAALKKPADIQPTTKNPADYDMVIIGTPVWAFTVACAVRTWMTQHAADIKQTAFFCTMGGSGDDRTFNEMEKLAGQRPQAVMSLLDKDIKAGRHQTAIENFTKDLQVAVGQ
ncbi:MAG: hypothetical protein EHM48_01990 [Planctomycetaceae bacterium]|nr:MAG: hypothetical protein EHM48_01990 [Planctomycetaceae bacterium]